MNAAESAVFIDLAAEADFELGRTTVRPSLRQVESGDDRETLEPRVMQVLVALARRRGEVVSRDVLISACWGGRIVGEDAINRSVARVRRVGEATGAFSLETIPRVGYRLLEAETGPAASAGQRDSNAPATAEPDAATNRRRRLIWVSAGAVGAIALMSIVAWNLTPNRQEVDVDRIVARLTETLQQERGPQDAAMAGSALAALGSSRRPEERSAFEALASEDGAHALDILENLAKQLEASGDLAAAADTYGRLGSIATLVDPLRALHAQRKAFELNPRSLRSFQSLFFTHFFTRDRESERFAARLLEDERLDDRMRGWVLSHLAFVEADNHGLPDTAEATVARIRALATYDSDPVLQAAAGWAEATIALNRLDYARAEELARASSTLWSKIPENTSDSAEVLVLRTMFERGDWAGMFRIGTAVLDRRTREGHLLPGVLVWYLCEAGLFTDQTQRALTYCATAVRRGEWHPAALKGYSAIIAAVEGDTALSRREMETAHGIGPPGGSIPGMILIYEAWIAQRNGDIAEAERLLSQRPAGRSWEDATTRRPGVLAMSHRLRGQWLIGAGQPQRACAPLAEAERAYAAYGGDAGRDAVQALRTAIGCST